MALIDTNDSHATEVPLLGVLEYGVVVQKSRRGAALWNPQFEVMGTRGI